MSHRNAPLTPQGRLRLVLRCQHRPIAHIAAESGVSRQCLGKWVARYREHGEAGLFDQSSAPVSRPTQTPAAVVDLIAAMRKKKWSARRIARELADQHESISVATVTRWLHRLGVGRLDHLDVDGEPLRKPGKITAHWPGHMIHIDIKKVARIPDGGGWRIHGVDSDQARAAARTTAKAKVRGARPGYVYLHSAVDGFSRLAYTEALPDETAKTRSGSCSEPASGSLPTASPGSPASSPTTGPATAPRTSPEPCAPSRRAISGPGPIRHATTARSSGTSASLPTSCSTPTPGTATTNAPPPSAAGTFTTTTIDPTALPATSHRPHDSAQASPTS